MDETNLRRWKVRDTLFAPWRELPGRYTAAEMMQARPSKGECKVAVPIFESTAAPTLTIQPQFTSA